MSKHLTTVARKNCKLQTKNSTKVKLNFERQRKILACLCVLTGEEVTDSHRKMRRWEEINTDAETDFSVTLPVNGRSFHLLHETSGNANELKGQVELPYYQKTANETQIF